MTHNTKPHVFIGPPRTRHTQYKVNPSPISLGRLPNPYDRRIAYRLDDRYTPTKAPVLPKTYRLPLYIDPLTGPDDNTPANTSEPIKDLSTGVGATAGQSNRHPTAPLTA